VRKPFSRGIANNKSKIFRSTNVMRAMNFGIVSFLAKPQNFIAIAQETSRKMVVIGCCY